ncbi:sugar kinase [Caproicibacter sp. BJN0012]|uniref:sugar kinase n=1 Tax=Caproicibacter sp. BJN0012 TaxID=3110227 RepID=UPI002E0EE68F
MAEVLCMGDILVEIMRPKEDIPLNREDYFRGPFPSGAPAIFIDTVAKMGHSAAIIGGVGQDDFGDYIVQRLEKDHVDCGYIHHSRKLSTGCAFVTYFADGSRKFIFHMGNSAAVEVDAPDLSDMNCLKFFHVMGTALPDNRRFAGEIIKTMHAALAKGAKVSFDPNIRPELMRDPEVYDSIREVTDNASVLMPGREELMLITGEKNLEDAVRKSFDNPVLEILALKSGSRGSVIYDRRGSTEVGTYPVKVLDTTGAGDCFDAAFLCGLLEGKTLKAAAEMATAAASLNCAAFGPMEGRISPEAVGKMIAESRLV